MSDDKTSISQVNTYQEIGEFWDAHDSADFWQQTEQVEFDVDLKTEARYYALEPKLATQVAEFARHKGISAETLLNLWVQEKIHEAAA
ncbi:MAG: hypothetical protein H6649_12345 [Caldilineae bacterium]|nr:hypothetical protein [Anaerolineae bacterium]MCB0202605.1 hypothetical protein [Anaerolineae bacterium]MCB0207028.1 hypothetical protein [Anaerolineae bacterium]MCB0253210.1 hypothetical protein [Anaerolineae bacterium]MCB9154826.1 hypothetical protein [Caldilineae bacterium]